MTERRRIHAVSIRDFRGITALDLDFTDGSGAPLDTVVLAGANGSGKTTILDAILLTLDREDLITTPSPKQLRFGSTNGSIATSLGSVYSHIELRGTTTSLPIVDSRISRRVEYFSASRAVHALPGEAQKNHRLAESKRLDELAQRLINTYYRSLRHRSSTSTLFSRLQTLWERFDPHGRRLEVLPRDNNPGSGDMVILCNGPQIPEDITSVAMAYNLAPTRPDIPTLVPLDALSSGQMALFAFAGPLIFRDEPADIVLIDEPEQHMHVQWQRLLLPALRELCPDTQFIVATHSEEILDSVLSYERFILVDDDDPRAHIVEPGAAAE